MSAQREKPMSPTARAIVGAIRELGGECTGAQIEQFRNGWAFAVLGNYEKAHYWVRKSIVEARALCGAIADPKRLFEPGNFPRCQLCVKKKSHL